ncbi:MAG: peptidylprolyl isomerase [Deltaproteobacteria bacterium]|nr:peptidylprolyl isomerase [Deltaproteobacteria bacterium]MBW2019599.1 peptidylprolyl isomerase [Deltaproteobacteria bacterium]MBW2074414.1 peptidylprolyl isomerase [Deltaproteobacteria bacterium]
MQLKRSIWLWLLLFLAGGVVHVSAWAEEKQPSEGKVAVVNGAVITRADLDRQMGFLQQRLRRWGMLLNESQLSNMKKKALEDLVDLELLYQESKNKGIQVDEASLDERIKALKKRFPKEGEYRDLLRKMNLSEDSMKFQIRREMATQQLVDEEIAQKVTVSDKEIREYYDGNANFFKEPEQVRASHILIKVDPNAGESKKAEARKKIEKIEEKLKAGADFSGLAKEFSECPSSVRGGDLGYFARGQMVRAFEEAAFASKPGQVSGIVETRFGYHLIKVEDKKPQSMIPFEVVRDRLEEYLTQEKIQKQLTSYIEGLKKKAKIERFLIKNGK